MNRYTYTAAAATSQQGSQKGQNAGKTAAAAGWSGGSVLTGQIRSAAVRRANVSAAGRTSRRPGADTLDVRKYHS